MKYIYTLLATVALAVGCNAVPTQVSTTRDVASIIDNQQRLIVLSMSAQTGGGSEVERAMAMTNRTEYEIAQIRLQAGIANSDVAVRR